MELLKAVGVGLPVFLVIDFVWIGLIANSFYKNELGSLARRSGDSLDPRLLPAFILYLLVVVGIAVFVLPKARGLGEAAMYGALFGVIGYSVYDLTNYATLAGFTLKMTVVDMIWGGVICGLTTTAMYYVVGR